MINLRRFKNLLSTLAAFAVIGGLTVAASPKNADQTKKAVAKKPTNSFEEPARKSSQVVKDDELGVFIVDIKDNIEPANFNLELTVSVLCRDNGKVKKSLNPPAIIKLAEHKKLCSISRPLYDKKSKILLMEFTQDSGYGDSPQEVCDIPMTQEFDLNVLCRKWNK